MCMGDSKGGGLASTPGLSRTLAPQSTGVSSAAPAPSSSVAPTPQALLSGAAPAPQPAQTGVSSTAVMPGGQVAQPANPGGVAGGGGSADGTPVLGGQVAQVGTGLNDINDGIAQPALGGPATAGATGPGTQVNSAAVQPGLATAVQPAGPGTGLNDTVTAVGAPAQPGSLDAPTQLGAGPQQNLGAPTKPGIAPAPTASMYGLPPGIQQGTPAAHTHAGLQQIMARMRAARGRGGWGGGMGGGQGPAAGGGMLGGAGG